MEHRLLVLAPTPEDAALSSSIIGGAGLSCVNCADVEDLAREMERGVAAILLTEGILAAGDPEKLIQTIRAQPEWSDIPVLLLAGGGADAPAAVWLMEALGNVTVLERPVRIITLISAIRSALKARQRQYQVRDQLLEIRAAQQSLEQDAQRKDEFLATLAHELRNPLAPISNMLYMLQHTGADSTRVHSAIDMMSRQVSHMVRLVDDLLDVSRITRGVVELRREPVQLVNAINAAVEAARPMIDAGEHTLMVEMPPETLSIDADAVRLTQILTNLLNNAAKYTSPHGTITLRCQFRPASAEQRDEVEIEVSDSGVGIPDDMLDRVFDMFTQVEHSRVLARGGLGIGLTLVRSLVELHGGSVEARSAGVGEGSQFIVRLPVSSTSQPRATRPSEPPAANNGIGGSPIQSRRVLIVDDNHDAADSLAAVLRNLGASAEVAYDGYEALARLGKFAADLVLLDIGMPGIDGYELARQIRGTKAGAGMLLIAQTGWGHERERQLSVDAGIDHHLVKPIDVGELERLASAGRPRRTARQIVASGLLH